MASNPDFRDLFSALSAAQADFIVVGAHAVMFHSVPRYTKDLDIWVRPTPENAERVCAALLAFGAPMADVTPADFVAPGTILQIGIEPNRVDILTSIAGLSFEKAWATRVHSTYDGVAIALLSREDLVVAKKAAGRPQDLLDVEKLLRPKKP